MILWMQQQWEELMLRITWIILGIFKIDENLTVELNLNFGDECFVYFFTKSYVCVIFDKDFLLIFGKLNQSLLRIYNLNTL